MTARAEGFWWVRLRGGTVGWEVVRLEYGSLWRMGTAAQIDAEHEVEQWGPYLGKEPGDQNRLPGLSRWGKLAPAGADTLRIADDEGRRPVRTLTTVADVNLEDVDPYPKRNSDENRLIHGVPDGWDLVWWKHIEPGDTVRYREGPHFSGDRQRVHEGTVERVDVSGPTIRIAGISGFNPTVNPSGWLRLTEETPDPLHWDQRDLDGAQAILEAEQERSAGETPTP